MYINTRSTATASAYSVSLVDTGIPTLKYKLVVTNYKYITLLFVRYV